MSLINDMLRNLEAKRPDDLARQNLQSEIRSLPPAATPRLRLGPVLALSSLLALALGGAVLHLDSQLLPLLGIVETPPPAVAAVPAPVVLQPAVPVLTPTPPELQPAPVADDLKLAQGLSVLPMPAAPVLPVPDPVAPPREVKPEAPPAKSETAAIKVAATTYAGPVSIEKSPVLATPRDRADAEYRKAETTQATGRSGEATEALRAALKHDAGHVPARQALLRQLLDQRRFEEAMSMLQEGLDLQPMQTGWAMSLARLQLERGDVTAADRTLGRSQDYGETNADYAAFQGHLKTRLGAHRLAVAHYQRAARLSPGEGRWWLGLGLAQEADGKAAESKEALRRALASATLSGELTAVAEQHLR
ncbi:tetratricopeptide repeat protein [Dechloromonas sp. A34]|uniref:tetratricopeptide repeat protein n=1 Tax=Dechloromonas sp. A34 TaxID=447588 RepID=UPI002248E97D|nr:tetratricopeptide repeat protein [Dechloromonas sp. A34]